ncbi:MAG: RagB/SusD family nutrient uptake outer membrane protein [Bacteroidales bacterium]
MKLKKIYSVVLVAASLYSCQEGFLDKTPEAYLSESTYFKNASQFQANADYLHTCVYAWNGNTTYPISFDYGSDINSIQDALGSGINTVPSADAYWNQAYSWLRHINVYLSKAEVFEDKASIEGPTGQALFFRAWQHFFLLKRFGGVPIANTVTQTNSDVVWGPRASRYQVVEQIVLDLDSAIAKLDRANVTKASTGNNGKVTLEAAKAFKARVCLYEGTWEKYNGTSTDGDGTTIGAGTAGYDALKANEYLTMAKNLAKEIIDDAQFSLWNGVDEVSSDAVANKAMYKNTSCFYLFNLEDAQSNPNGLTKSSNHEAIFRSVYDYTYRKGGTNLTHTKPAGVTRKLMDMYLCTDGLPIQHSSQFQGYSTMTSEFENRDHRLTALVHKPGNWYWGYLKYNTGANYSTDITSLAGATYQYYPNLTGNGGYTSRKFGTESNQRSDNEESADYMHIRLAEIYLIYAEAVCELGSGVISDVDLDYSINHVRTRAGVARLTNALIAPYADLTLLGEIRRERALELHGEGHRISDLCRWGIADEELGNKPVCGLYIDYLGTPTEYKTFVNPNTSSPVYNASSYSSATITQTDVPISSYSGIVATKAGALITEQASNRKFSMKNYLQPIPSDQIKINPKLLQNPQW